MLVGWLHRVWFLLTRQRVERELDAELAFHLEQKARALVDEGLDPREARLRARRALGGALHTRETSRDVWLWRGLESAFQDVRFGLRLLRRHPGFALAAVLTLGAGIAATTTVFSVANAFLLRPPPVAQPDRLVWLFTTSRHEPFGAWSHPDYRDLAAASDVLEHAAAYSGAAVSVVIDAAPQLVVAEVVSGNYFDALGVEPMLGRAFRSEEDTIPDAHPVVVLSERFWRVRLGSDRSVVGRRLTINGLTFTVIGVAPPRFSLAVERTPELFLPLMMQRYVRTPSGAVREALGDSLLPAREVEWLRVVARLRPDVTIERARARLAVVAGQLAQHYPDTSSGQGIDLQPVLQGDPTHGRRPYHVAALLSAVSGIVLLVACANVAILLVARSSLRRREIGVRLSLGVARGRLIRLLVTESLVLGCVGGVAGLALSSWLLRLVPLLLPPSPMPLELDFSADHRVLLFTAAISLTTGLVFGIAPAMQASRVDVVTAVKDAPGAGSPRLWGRQGLVSAQLALSLLLAVSAGLLLRSVSVAARLDPGFSERSVLLATTDLDLHQYTKTTGMSFYARLLEELRATPGVAAVALSHVVPLSGSWRAGWATRAEDVPSPEEPGVRVGQNTVTPGYFETLGIPLVDGRPFTDEDREGRPLVVIVNDTLAKRLWADGRAVGRRLRIGGATSPALEVVGIATGGRYRELGEEPQGFVYVPFAQRYDADMVVHIRTTGDPAAFASQLRQVVNALDSSLPLYDLRTLGDHLALARAGYRSLAIVTGAFGAVSLLLASVGLYGVVAQLVAARTREIGLRVALGATPAAVLGMLLRQAGWTVGVGIALGLAAALLTAPLLRQALVGVGPIDPLTLVAAPIVLAATSLVAVCVPTRRALRLDPAVVLRAE
jgi:predicted permease